MTIRVQFVFHFSLFSLIYQKIIYLHPAKYTPLDFISFKNNLCLTKRKQNGECSLGSELLAKNIKKGKKFLKYHLIKTKLKRQVQAIVYSITPQNVL